MPDPLMRPVRPDDSAAWLRLRTAHWPDGTADHPAEIAAFFAHTITEPLEVFVAETQGQCIALLELSIRTDLPGFLKDKVGYVEGLYIVPEFRGQSLVRRLLRSAQSWARQKHCTLFASDRAGRVIVDRHYRL